MPPNQPDISAFTFVPGGPDLTPEQLASVDEYRERVRPMSLVNDLFMRVCFQGRREEGVSPAPNLLAAERMLGVILNRELTVLNVATQSELTNLMGRSVVMDILAEDAAKNLYNIEIQLDPRGANPKRPRYILSVIDASVKHPGKHFEHLHETFSIFIVMGDPFDEENPQPIHVFTRKNEAGRPLGDGTTIIYVNAKMRNYVTWLGLLMHDLRCVNPDEMFFPELRAITRHIKEETEGVFTVQNMSEKIYEEGWKGGREVGRQEGRRETNRDNVVRMLGLGKTLEDIAQSLALPQDEVRLMAEQLRGA